MNRLDCLDDSWETIVQWNYWWRYYISSLQWGLHCWWTRHVWLLNLPKRSQRSDQEMPNILEMQVDASHTQEPELGTSCPWPFIRSTAGRERRSTDCTIQGPPFLALADRTPWRAKKLGRLSNHQLHGEQRNDKLVRASQDSGLPSARSQSALMVPGRKSLERELLYIVHWRSSPSFPPLPPSPALPPDDSTRILKYPHDDLPWSTGSIDSPLLADPSAALVSSVEAPTSITTALQSPAIPPWMNASLLPIPYCIPYSCFIGCQLIAEIGLIWKPHHLMMWRERHNRRKGVLGNMRQSPSSGMREIIGDIPMPPNAAASDRATSALSSWWHGNTPSPNRPSSKWSTMGKGSVDVSELALNSSGSLDRIDWEIILKHRGPPTVNTAMLYNTVRTRRFGQIMFKKTCPSYRASYSVNEQKNDELRI